MEADYKVSVVVIVKNDPRIRYMLESLLAQMHKPHEVIVVADYGNDPSLAIAKEYTSALPLKIVVNDIAPGYGGARAKGVSEAQGDIIAFIDADCIAHSDWIKNLLLGFRKPHVYVQVGRTLGIEELGDGLEHFKWSRIEFDEGSIKPISFAPTQNFAFKREVIKNVGNFDPDFAEGSEDLDFCIRLRKAGYTIYYNSNAIVYHFPHKFSLRRLWRDGRARARALLKHGSALFSDAFTCFFHATSLLMSFTLLVMGFSSLAVLTLTPSLAHRLYRAIINMRRSGKLFTSLLNSLITYLSHLSFAISFAISLLSLSLTYRRKRGSGR